ncbi:monovalent cation/H(+) antiporter subunit G [Halomonas elongata]|uniref:Monovalent cation/H(+) antiporter subunit G n=3 Tax=Halomonas elongata TaxID=2746 RepID=E1V712_HALED|nr:monovalent cation/H(+) antiporter subunit G [Halomonas elongata]MBW5799524.1 monovalent cation/H(+) antiporter subunit G [Halomonas elongata]OBX34182.1 Na(+)/H(+) antiporter subunit G [Halomonas elongata]RAW09047.1 Na+/H+ antiporter subunit G [Halomonas elongata]WBF17139.1 monovalent cation/H(+) antiporter subunit G [Halomonas elongata]WPU45973.1 monovalent cation/H(+) antiporter subunit G [Halomonas elongata DSM 2581]
MTEWLVAGLALMGAVFMCLAALGIVRLPDLLTRMHATTKAATLGVSLTMLGVAVHFAEEAVVARAFGIILFIMMTAPVAAHIIGRAGYFVGARLWDGTVKDELKPHYDPLSHRLDSGLESEQGDKADERGREE